MMLISPWLKIGIFALLAGGLVGCSQWRQEGTPRYLLPVLDEQGNESLQEVELPTLYSPYKVEGSVARIYYNPVVRDGSFGGSVAEPHLAKSGDLYIPKDPESGMVLAAYSFF